MDRVYGPRSHPPGRSGGHTGGLSPGHPWGHSGSRSPSHPRSRSRSLSPSHSPGHPRGRSPGQFRSDSPGDSRSHSPGHSGGHSRGSVWDVIGQWFQPTPAISTPTSGGSEKAVVSPAVPGHVTSEVTSPEYGELHKSRRYVSKAAWVGMAGGVPSRGQSPQ